MTLAEQERTAAVPAAAELAYQRSMDRVLVHRRAVMEVFVTDAARLGEDRFAVAVQAPRAHAYYNDHTQRPALLDPLFLLEAARQAVTVVAHQWLGVSYDTSFLISDWTTEFTDLPALRSRGDAPDELVIEIGTRDLRRRGTRLLAATLDCAFVAGGRRAGTSVIVAGYLSRDGYQAHRAKSRGTVPPLSSERPDTRAGTPCNRRSSAGSAPATWCSSTSNARADRSPCAPSWTSRRGTRPCTTTRWTTCPRWP